MFRVLFLLSIFSSTAYASEIIDLGTFGSFCELKPAVTNSLAGLKIRPDFSLNFSKVDFSYKPRLTLNPVLENKVVLKSGAIDKRIFIFGALDENSKLFSKDVNADYALCVNFDSIKDITTFRQETGMKIPIQMANDEMLRFLQIDSYPALITIKGGGEDAKVNN